MTVLFHYLLTHYAFADGFNDAYDEEVEEQKEYQEALQEQDESYRNTLEACKETPETDECQQFLIQHAVKMGLDPDKYLEYIQKKSKKEDKVVKNRTELMTPNGKSNRRTLNNVIANENKPEDNSQRTKKLLVTVQGGLGIGDVSRSYDTRVGFLPDAETIFDIYEYDTFFPGTGATVSALISYKVTKRIGVGVQVGILTGAKELSTGWQMQEDDGSIIQEDSFQQVVTSTSTLIEPRLYGTLLSISKFSLDAFTGLYTRMYDSYTVPDALTVNYSNQPGGLHYGATFGLSTAVSVGKSGVVSVELPWTLVINQQPYERSVLLEDSYVEGDPYVRGTPDRPPYYKQVLLPKIGFGNRF